MAHDTHHSEHNPNQKEISKSRTSFQASFWFVIIVVGLFIAAINFVSVMSHDTEEGTPAKEEMTQPATSAEGAATEHAQPTTDSAAMNAAAVAKPADTAKH